MFGGAFDDEFQAGSRRFFDNVGAGKAVALISDILIAEMVEAPEQVQELLERTLEGECERLELRAEIEDLRDNYLGAGVLSAKWADDALHVAHATTARADVLVSWNFKHLVNPLRIRAFNGVNAAQGYGPVVIMTPEDLAKNWEEEDDENQEE